MLTRPVLDLSQVHLPSLSELSDADLATVEILPDLPGLVLPEDVFPQLIGTQFYGGQSLHSPCDQTFAVHRYGLEALETHLGDDRLYRSSFNRPSAKVEDRLPTHPEIRRRFLAAVRVPFLVDNDA